VGVKSKGWNGWGILPKRIFSELQFWYRNIQFNTPYVFQARLPQASLTTDASERGWGAVFICGDLYYITYGSFSTLYDSTSSNLRETTAVLRALLNFRSEVQKHQIHCLSLRTGNIVTVFNLQRQGASESLLYETRQIFSFLLKMDIRLQTTHIPGVENITADALSRMDAAGDYELRQEFYQRGIRFLGVTPTLNLFAAKTNAKCPSYLALPGVRAEGARALDALRYSWREEIS
jgi:hypothetical protein